MELRELMATIEDHRFSAEVNLAAGPKAFNRGLQNHPMFQALLVAMANHLGASEMIAERVKEISRQEVDTRYENMFDVALSAYLMALRDTNTRPETLADAALAALGATNCWWTPELSRELLVRVLPTGAVSQAVAKQLSPVLKLPDRELQSGQRMASINEVITQGFESQRTFPPTYVIHILERQESGTQTSWMGDFANPKKLHLEQGENRLYKKVASSGKFVGDRTGFQRGDRLRKR
jgi:hypothetical protein